MSAKFENLAMQRKARSVCVDPTEYACINCTYYEQYFRRNRGNVCTWAGTSKGYCLLLEQSKGAFTKPCKRFERDCNDK